jgi:apolipoprotein N-acyltransferase
MDSSWVVDVITAGLVLAWMAWTFATMQQYGPSPALIGGAVVVGLVGLLAIHGQYVTYLRLGDWLAIGRKPPQSNTEREREEDRNR